MANSGETGGTPFSKTESHARIQEVYEMGEKVEMPTNTLSEPQELRADAKTEKFLVAYDCSLCAIPIVLIVKTILCIVASRIDKDNQNIYIDSVSQLAIFLVSFNGQVKYSPALVDAEDSNILISVIHSIHHCICYHHEHHGPSMGPLQSTRRRIPLGARAAAGKHFVI